MKRVKVKLWNPKKKRLWTKLAGDEIYEEFQRIYDEAVSESTDKEKIEDKMWNKGREKGIVRF